MVALFGEARTYSYAKTVAISSILVNRPLLVGEKSVVNSLILGTVSGRPMSRSAFGYL